MAQKIFLTYKQEDSSFDLLNMLAGVITSGLYKGYDFKPTSDLGLVLGHDETGLSYLSSDSQTVKTNVGVFRTKQGVVIQEDTELPPLPISATTTLPRIDLIVALHNYVEEEQSNLANIMVIQGVPAEVPVVPTITDVDRQTALGYIYLPESCTDLTLEGVVYTRLDSSIFNRQNFNPDLKANQDELDLKANQDELDALTTVVQGKAPLSANYAYTDSVNSFTKQQRLAKGSNLIASSSLDLGDSGNLHRVSDGTINHIKAIQSGTRIVLRVDETGFTLKNKIGAPPENFKQIISPTGTDISLITNLDWVEIIEDDDGWLILTPPPSYTSIPIGSIMTWAGGFNDIPSGWQYANGQNGTEDLRGRFILGADDGTPAEYELKSIGGEKEVTLTLDQLPDWGLDVNAVVAKVTGANTPDSLDNSANEIDVQNTDNFPDFGGESHNNMPPYKALIIIQKIS